MKDYTGNIETASRLIGKFGANAFIVRRGADTGPAHNPVAGADTRTATTAVDIGFQKVTRDGALTEMRTFLLDPAQIEPEASDKLAFGGDLYSIDMIDKTAPAGVSVLHKAMVTYMRPDE